MKTKTPNALVQNYNSNGETKTADINKFRNGCECKPKHSYLQNRPQNTYNPFAKLKAFYSLLALGS